MNLTNFLMAQDTNRQANINSVFDKMEFQGVETKKPLLYGYFFYDNDKFNLSRFMDELAKKNYKLVRLDKTEEQGYILHIEKIEAHSRTSLLERENELDKLSKKFHIQTYDGWDVGSTDPEQPLVSIDNFVDFLNNKSDIELYKIANYLYDHEINDKAILAFQKCIDYNYRLDTCYYKQGVSIISIGEMNAGIEKLEETLKINPKYYKAILNLATLYYEKDEYQKSVEHYSKALQINSEDDRAYYGLAASQVVLGKLDDARLNCEKALKINPDNDYAKLLLEKLMK
jgi:tetratricopeptide (TPR) repeat protein